MEAVYTALVVLHLFGMAALVGGWLAVEVGVRSGSGSALAPGPVMLWGARLQLLTGLALVGLGEASLDKDYDSVKIAVKLVVALAVVALVEIASGRSRRGRPVAPVTVHVAGVLGVLNVLVAVLWG